MGEITSQTIPLLRKLLLVLVITLWAAILGPAIGGMLISIPFCYIFGGPPAFIGGLLAGVIIAFTEQRVKYTWVPRMALGISCGVLACVAVGYMLEKAMTVSLLPFGLIGSIACSGLFQHDWITACLSGGYPRRTGTKLPETHVAGKPA